MKSRVNRVINALQTYNHMHSSVAVTIASLKMAISRDWILDGLSAEFDTDYSCSWAFIIWFGIINKRLFLLLDLPINEHSLNFKILTDSDFFHFFTETDTFRAKNETRTDKALLKKRHSTQKSYWKGEISVQQLSRHFQLSTTKLTTL